MKRKGITLLCCLFCLPATSKADTSIYGAAHVSTDLMLVPGYTEYAVSSNASHFGITGVEKVNIGLTIEYQFESAFDLSGEKSSFSARNRYIGVLSPFGGAYAGYFDTPYKNAGERSEMFNNTIGDRRSILGKRSGSTDVHMDIRSPNSIMYISPVLDNYQAHILVSTGDDNLEFSDGGRIMSSSFYYDGEMFYLGVASEERLKDDVYGLRIVAGFDTPSLAVHAIYEKMDTSTKKIGNIDRTGYGFGIRYNVFDSSLRWQSHFANPSLHADPENGAAQHSFGLYQRFSKHFHLYVVGTVLVQSGAGDFAIAPHEHGETYLSGPGKSSSGYSVGLEYKFGKR